jgi:hypothetical protein
VAFAAKPAGPGGEFVPPAMFTERFPVDEPRPAAIATRIASTEGRFKALLLK